ncbi:MULTISPECIES: YbfB/YjiJ family MFS transporter [Thermus]|jgi:MFS family permease|uniref:Major Facilitator Superfamily protein n=1 Tax=Thermus brockianus TaxID=56956 RepID=A0A1J0LTM1_THEBO|nr:YbfB/YjiJ family MFS transporter [Thermus brockianus]APD09027.1 Major Facilitator Superfamily protein [Thermus brockianus]
MATRALLLALGPGVALGLGRFAYALVLPLMQATWGLSYAQAGLLGSANTLGYFLGALFSHRLLGWLGYRRGFFLALLLQGGVLALTGAGGYPLAFGLRLLQGVLGALVFVGGAALLMALGGTGRALGAYYGGVGLGILLAPWFLWGAETPGAAFFRLGLGSLLLSLAPLMAWGVLKEPPPPARGEGSLRPILPLLLAYGLYGAGYIGYMTFVTTAVGNWTLLFTLLSVGALLTGVVWGPWVERVGGRRGLFHVLLVLFLGSLPPLAQGLPGLSAFLFGLAFLGVITAITQAFRALLPPSAWPRAMGLSTAAFALGQALGPTLAGLGAEALGRGEGALWVASGLLALALLPAWPQRP